MPKTFPAVTDHSWGRPPPQAIKDAGYIGLGRYLGYDVNGRDISKQELLGYLNVGLRVFFIVQGGKNTVLGGWAKGAEHGRMANERLRDLGVPPGSVKIVSTVVDYDAPGSDVRGPIAEYAKGFNSTSLYEHIPYGSDKTLNILCGELGLFPCGWQTCAWSGGRTSAYACMTQEIGYVLGDTSDHNNIINMEDVDILLHPATPAPEPEEEEEMPAVIHLWTSSKNNREWLESIGYRLPAGVPDWDSNWAGLGVWEAIEGRNDIRYLTGENADLLKGMAAWLEATGGHKTIVDDGFMETKWFRSRTVRNYDKDGSEGHLLPPELSGKA